MAVENEKYQQQVDELRPANDAPLKTMAGALGASALKWRKLIVQAAGFLHKLCERSQW